ncbi:hypothetical protein AAEO50_05275 [Rossellomorea oryzaecorticis]|uniref:Uncharacterized protein n=1 Tax=Rossellomorea oryzaecorticis TaxID=1396505 RepID=A0ABU9K6S2_9BACI
MRIRYYILMGVLVVAAAFLPTHAAAEKNNGAAHSGNAHPAEVHTSVVEKVKKVDFPQKAAPAATETKQKGQKEEVQKPEVIRERKPVTKENPVHETPGNKRQSGKAATPPTHKREFAPVSKPSVKEVEKRATERKNQQDNLREKQEEVSQSSGKFMPEPQREKELTFQKQQEKVNVGKKDAPIYQSIKKMDLVQRNPAHEGETNAPFEKRAIPGDVEAVNNVPQRLPSSGGQAQETFSQGTGMVSFIHHQAVWDIGLKLRTIYHSREDTYCYQWMNAPPSPPPKAAPFI